MHAQWLNDAAENEESLEPEDRRQRPRAGSVELSLTGTEWNACGFAYSNPYRNVYLWNCAGGDSISLIDSYTDGAMAYGWAASTSRL